MLQNQNDWLQRGGTQKINIKKKKPPWQKVAGQTRGQMWKYWYAIPFIFVRLLATFFSQIPDCDEVFNYWEPLHFLLYGSGSVRSAGERYGANRLGT